MDPSVSLGTLIAQWGAPGALVGALLLLFLWAFRRLFEHVLDSQQAHREYLAASVEAIKRLTDKIEDNHESLRHWFDDITDRINLVARSAVADVAGRIESPVSPERTNPHTPTPRPLTGPRRR